MKAALCGLSSLLGGNDEPAVFDGDSYLLTGQEPGVFGLDDAIQHPHRRVRDGGVAVSRYDGAHAFL